VLANGPQQEPTSKFKQARLSPSSGRSSRSSAGNSDITPPKAARGLGPGPRGRGPIYPPSSPGPLSHENPPSLRGAFRE
jgi:hypothetical protein